MPGFTNRVMPTPAIRAFSAMPLLTLKIYSWVIYRLQRANAFRKKSIGAIRMIEAEAMSLPYAVPLGDIRFALLHAAGSDDLENGVVEDDLVDQIVLEAGRFAAERLIPLNLSGDPVGARFAAAADVSPPG